MTRQDRDRLQTLIDQLLSGVQPLLAEVQAAALLQIALELDRIADSLPGGNAR